MSPYARRLLQASHVSSGSATSSAPAAPANITATPGDTSMTVWWNFPATATGYTVQYRISPSGTWTAWSYTGTLTRTTITGLTNGTLYDFRVNAINSHGASPWITTSSSVTPIATPSTGGGLPSTFSLALANSSTTDTVYAYVIGMDPNNNSAWSLVQSTGSGLYAPPIPGADHTALPVDCAIPLNARGASAKMATVPKLISGRIFFSYNAKLQFFTNKNGGFVMPSQTNSADPNNNVQWTFCEFTFDSTQLYGNVSFVDMLSIPLAFSLTVTDGTGTQYVPGLPDGGMHTVANALLAQKTKDGTDWDKCLVYDGNNTLVRVLSPNSTVQIFPTAFNGYLDAYVNEVFTKYQTQSLTVDTQYTYGTVTGTVSNNVLDFGSGLTYAKPTTADIFSCSTGPFTTGNDEPGNISARLAAAFNRTTLLVDSTQPTNEDYRQFYYTEAKTNHYSRIVHEVIYGNLGYGFPYDDVHPAGIDFEGRIESGAPSVWTVRVGSL